MSEAPQDTCPISVYDPSPVQARAAGLYVCSRLPKPAAVEVLAALGADPDTVAGAAVAGLVGAGDGACRATCTARQRAGQVRALPERREAMIDYLSHYYDRAGQPITLEQWSDSFGPTQDDWNRSHRVAETEVGDVRVSTVWLGLDHGYGGGPPLIFETMVFGGAHDEDQWRYPTEVEALAGHAEICSVVFRGEAVAVPGGGKP